MANQKFYEAVLRDALPISREYADKSLITKRNNPSAGWLIHPSNPIAVLKVSICASPVTVKQAAPQNGTACLTVSDTHGSSGND